MRQSITNHRLGMICLAGLAVFIVCIAALHWLQPELSPWREAMSYYVHGAHGWLTSVGLVALGIGSLAVTIGLSRTAQNWRGRLGVALLGLWALGAVLSGIFSADPPGNWGRPPSIAGMIHGSAAMIGLAAFPFATIALLPALRRDPTWQRLYSVMALLTLIVVICYIVFMASLAPVFIRPGPPILFGLTERILLAAYVAWLGVVAYGLFHARHVSLN